MNDANDSMNRTAVPDGEFISLDQLVSRTIHCRRIITLIIGAIAVAYLTLAVTLYLVTPETSVAKMDFRLDFQGAEKGEYPNGIKFSPAEIVAGPILKGVFEQNEINHYTSYDEFKNSLVVITSNIELDSLIRDYAAKLSESNLTHVERDRLEREFAEKKASLSKANLSIQMQTTDRLTSIPRPLRAKILNDILAAWAEQTIQDKGVMLYDISIISSRVFGERPTDGYDYLVALDLLRSRIARVIGNIDEMQEIPGARVVRAGTDGASLEELRLHLEETQEFRIRPLVGMLIANGISIHPDQSRLFVHTQLQLTELEAMEARARVEAIRDALNTYVRERQQESQTGREPLAAGVGSVIPQVDGSFLDRIVAMSANDNDLQYRQEMVDDLRKESMDVVPLEAEGRYYRALLDGFRTSVRTPTATEKESIDAQIELIHREAVTTTDKVNEIYKKISQDLNPSAVLYSLTTPPSNSTARSVSGKMLLLSGVLILLMSFPFVIAGVLVWDRLRGEQKRTRAAQDEEVDPAKA